MSTKNTQQSSFSTLTLLEIFKNTFQRWKVRIFSYLLTVILFALLWISINALITIFTGMIIIIGLIFIKSLYFTLLIAGIALLLVIVISTYLFLLFILTSVSILIGKRQPIFSLIQSLRPTVLGYFWVALSSSLFLLGLFPFGFMTLFVVPILWTFWSSFTTFVYLDKREKGLRNLWISRSIYNQNFWPLLIKSLIPFGGGIAILVLYSLVTEIIPFNIASHIFFYVLLHIINIVYGSLVICYNYELYRHLPDKPKVTTPKIWIILSVIGWIINVALLFFFSYAFSRISPDLQQYYEYIAQYGSHKKMIFTQDPNIHYFTTPIGQSVSLEDRSFDIESFQQNFKASQADNLSFLEKFILVNVRITNTSQHIIAYSPFDFFIINKNGDLIGPNFSFSLADTTMLGSGKLAPGAQKIGAILFRVTSQTAPFTLLYQPIINAPINKFAVEIKLN